MTKKQNLPRSPQFGAILLRANELIGAQGVQAFDELGIAIDARKISIVLALLTKGPQSSTEFAVHTGLSRQLIEVRLKAAVKEGLLVTRVDPEDSRRRLYELSPQSAPNVKRLAATMKDFEKVYDQLWAEIGVDMENALLRMEHALKERPLIERLCDTFPKYKKERAVPAE